MGEILTYVDLFMLKLVKHWTISKTDEATKIASINFKGWIFR